MQMDLHGFVGAHADVDQVVLTNCQHSRFGGRRFAMNLEVENAVFRTSACYHRSEQRCEQQRARAMKIAGQVP